MTGNTAPPSRIDAPGEELFLQRKFQLYRRTDRLFAFLMLGQWAAALGCALWLTPRSWSGTVSTVHPHVWLALFFGGCITLGPVLAALLQPGRTATRHVIAAGQVLMSALLIHLTGGRIETHFHIFGSLAFLAFYRDVRVLLTATAVVASDHFLRGSLAPQSIYGSGLGSSWRWMEHAGWVLFEDSFLFVAIRQSLSEMRGVALRQSQLEGMNCEIERQVHDRTQELARENAERRSVEVALRSSEQRFRQLADNITQVFWMATVDRRQLLYLSPEFERIWGCSIATARAEPAAWLEAMVEEDRPRVWQAFAEAAQGRCYDTEYRICTPAGQRWIRDRGFPVRDDSGAVVRVCGTAEDITPRKHAEKRLEETQSALRDLSRQSGMAEVATSVLHNVGNVLNSVNVSIGVATEKVASLKVGALGKLAGLLHEHRDALPEFVRHHPQGSRLPGFVTQMAEYFGAEQKALLGEFDLLRRNVDHVNEIVAMQQSYATGGGLIETLAVEEVIEDALRMNAGALARHGSRVVRDFDRTLTALPLDRNKLLLILVNLIRNAKYACDDGTQNDKCVTL